MPGAGTLGGGGSRGGYSSSQRGGEVRGGPGAVPSCSGRPRVQVIQDRLWSGQSACSWLLGSGAGRMLRPGGASGAVASPSPRGAAPMAQGTGSAPPSPAGSRWPGSGTRVPPRGRHGGAGRGLGAGAGGALPSAPCPQVYVLKRPHVDEFLQRMGELFECVLFTASLAKVGAPAAPRHRPLLPGHPWGGTTPPCLPTPGHRLPLVPCQPAGRASAGQRCLPAPPRLPRETEARGELAPLESRAPPSLWGGHGGTACPGDTPSSLSCSMRTPWPTCWINGGLSERGFSGSPASSTAGTT